MQNIEPRFLLPLGSVVSLKGSRKKYMITRYFFNKPKEYISFDSEEDNNKQQFDYLSVLWPDGDVNPTIKLFFDHDDIDTIFYSGYINEESLEFMDDLSKAMNK